VNRGMWIGWQVYVVYMGSKSGEHPDDVLRENHQMLAAVHSGRSELRTPFSFFGRFSASLSFSCVFFITPLVLSKWFSHFFFPHCNVLTASNKPKPLMFIATNMLSEALQLSSVMNRLPKFLVCQRKFSVAFSFLFLNFIISKLSNLTPGASCNGSVTCVFKFDQKCQEWFLFFPILKESCTQLIHGISWDFWMTKPWRLLVTPSETKKISSLVS